MHARAHTNTPARTHTMRRVPTPPVVPAKAQSVSEASNGSPSGSRGPQGGGWGEGGKGKRTKSAPSNLFIAGLAAVVATTPLVGLSAKAQSDPQGFQTTLRDSLPACILKSPLFSGFT
jgi:hypothetical protein